MTNHPKPFIARDIERWDVLDFDPFDGNQDLETQVHAGALARARADKLTAVAEADAMSEGRHGDDLIRPRTKLHGLTETQLAEFEAHYDGSEPAGSASVQKQRPPGGPSASKNPLAAATEVHDPVKRPPHVDELTVKQLSSCERQYDEDDRIGFEMSAETYKWSPAEAEAVWRWIGDARNASRRP